MTANKNAVLLFKTVPSLRAKRSNLSCVVIDCFVAALLAMTAGNVAFARSNQAIKAFNEGVKAFNARQFNEAIPAFDEAISADAEFAEAYYARGACKYSLKSLDGALQDLNETLRLKPDHIDAQALRGAVQYEADRWDGALEDFSAVLSKNPRDAQSLLGRAVILLKREDLAGAARDFKGFLQIRPDDPLAPKVRQLVASLKGAGEAQRPPEPAPVQKSTARPSAGATRRAAAPSRQLSPEDLQRLADSLMSHTLSDPYQRKILHGERAQAVGQIQTNDTPQIVEPQ